MTVGSDFIYVYSGNCDGTDIYIRTSPYKKVFSISKWGLDYPFAFNSSLEAETVNYNYREGINSIPQILITSANKIYIVFSTPINSLSARNIQTCILKYALPMNMFAL